MTDNEVAYLRTVYDAVLWLDGAHSIRRALKRTLFTEFGI